MNKIILLSIGLLMVNFSKAQTCVAPTELSATNFTNFTADVSWTEMGTATMWMIEYGPSGFMQGTGIVLAGTVTNPHTLTNLMPCTAYDFYVRADCGGNVYSAWAGPHPFSTAGAATGTDTQVACETFTWIDGNTYTSDNNTATHTITGGAISGCDSIVTLDLTIEGAHDAGSDNAITVCKNEPLDLSDLLGSNAQSGGTWFDPTGASLSSSGIIASSTGGDDYDYGYTVGGGVCPADTAIFTVTADDGCDYLSVTNEIMAKIAVHPNPASTVLTIVNPANTADLKVEILDMNGRVVLIENKGLNSASETTLVIDPLEKGIYTLRVYNNEGQKVFKIVKH